MTTHTYGFTVIRMKTTVELPDDLVIEAKKRAAELRKPLRVLIERGLRAQLERSDPSQSPASAPKLEWLTAPGGLPGGVNLDDRADMHEWLRTQK